MVPDQTVPDHPGLEAPQHHSTMKAHVVMTVSYRHPCWRLDVELEHTPYRKGK